MPGGRGKGRGRGSTKGTKQKKSQPPPPSPPSSVSELDDQEVQSTPSGSDTADHEAGPSQKAKKQRGEFRIVDPAVEGALVEWFRSNEILWNKRLTDYRNKSKKDRMFDEKAAEIRYSGMYLQHKCV